MAAISSTTSLVGSGICVVRGCECKALSDSMYCYKCDLGLETTEHQLGNWRSGSYATPDVSRMFAEAAEQLSAEIDGWTEEQREEWLAEYGA